LRRGRPQKTERARTTGGKKGAEESKFLLAEEKLNLIHERGWAEGQVKGGGGGGGGVGEGGVVVQGLEKEPAGLGGWVECASPKKKVEPKKQENFFRKSQSSIGGGGNWERGGGAAVVSAPC